jgi:hypothetical protein
MLIPQHLLNDIMGLIRSVRAWQAGHLEPIDYPEYMTVCEEYIEFNGFGAGPTVSSENPFFKDCIIEDELRNLICLTEAEQMEDDLYGDIGEAFGYQSQASMIETLRVAASLSKEKPAVKKPFLQLLQGGG